MNAPGFHDFRLSYMAVFLYRDPDGVAPGALVQRAWMSKQAMHQLLESLERLGCLERAPALRDRRARDVQLTDRGWTAFRVIGDILRAMEREGAEALGAEHFATPMALLTDLWSVVQEQG